MIFREAFDLAEKLEAEYEAEWQYIPYMSRIPHAVTRITAGEMIGAQIKAVAEIMNSPEFEELYSLTKAAAGI